MPQQPLPPTRLTRLRELVRELGRRGAETERRDKERQRAWAIARAREGSPT